MYINYVSDRRELGFSCFSDEENFVDLLNSIFKSSKKVTAITLISSKQFVVAGIIFFTTIDSNVQILSFIPNEAREIVMAAQLKNKLKPSNNSSKLLGYILQLNGGEYELDPEKQKQLVESILSKTPNGNITKISINKLVKKIIDFAGPGLSNSTIWQLVKTYNDPISPPISPIDSPTQVDCSKNLLVVCPKNLENLENNRPKGLEVVKDDFEIRASQQKINNRRDLKILKYKEDKTATKFQRLKNFIVRPFSFKSRDLKLSDSSLPHYKTTSELKQKQRFHSLNQQEANIALFGTNEGMNSASVGSPTPTAQLFSADIRTGEISDINVAFTRFKERMEIIGNTYTGKKREYFFEQLNKCSFERFESLCTEKGRVTFNTVREAETVLQSEFAHYHEPNSMQRPTAHEEALGNRLDGRFRIGVLSGELNTLNEHFTDFDVKGLVGQATLEFQANTENRDIPSVYDQAQSVGSKLFLQKRKHCKPDIPEVPASPADVKHIINLIELSSAEKEIAKNGIIEGVRTAWSEELNVPKNTISDQAALEGIMFLNDDCTIERIN